MTCKDCIHYDVCVIVEYLDTDYDHCPEYGCKDFKNKTDLVEVVRCRDCNLNGTEYCICDPTVAKDDDDFCSYGERKGV